MNNIKAMRGGQMVYGAERNIKTLNSGGISDLNDSEEDLLPVRTNFSKVILKTYSNLFSLHN